MMTIMTIMTFVMQVRPSLLVSASILTAIHGLCPEITSATGFQVTIIVIIIMIYIIIIIIIIYIIIIMYIIIYIIVKSSKTEFQNLLCNMVGARMHELVLLVRQLEVRVAGWIKAATKEPKTSQQISNPQISSQQSAAVSNNQQQQGRRGGIKQGLSALAVGDKDEEERVVGLKRQKTKESLQEFRGQQAFWGVSQDVVRMDTT